MGFREGTWGSEKCLGQGPQSRDMAQLGWETGSPDLIHGLYSGVPVPHSPGVFSVAAPGPRLEDKNSYLSFFCFVLFYELPDNVRFLLGNGCCS